MSGLLPFLITGLVAGSLYGVAGIGLVLTYRTSGVFNFAHGGVAAAAAFAFSSAHDDWGWPWPVAAAFVVLVFGVVGGWVLERLTRALAGAPDAITVVATVGLLLAIEGTLFPVYGPIPPHPPAFPPTSGFRVAGVHGGTGQG